MPLLPNINVGTAPNDGTGDTIRNAFIKVNENFQFIEAFFPNTDVANLTANITSTGISTFNIVNGSTIGNAGATLTGATLNASTIGNSGATLTGSTVNAATIGNAGTAFVGASISAATIGNTGATLTGSTVNAATIGNTNTILIGTIDSTYGFQPNITTIGTSATSNVTINGNLILNSSVSNVKTIQHVVFSANAGTYNVGFLLSNTQVGRYFMNADVTLTLVGTIESGVQKDYYFINDTGTVKYANIFVYGNRTNKGTNSISVASNTVTLIHMISTDDTAANILAIVSNT